MLGNLNGWHLLILLAVILLLFGAAKLPSLARSAGQSARLFKSEIRAMKDEEAPTGQTAEPGEDRAFAPITTGPSGSTKPPVPG